MTTGCRKMHSADLHDFYSSPNACFQVGQTNGKGWAKSWSWMVVFVEKVECRRRIG